jgi:putative metal-binding protein
MKRFLSISITCLSLVALVAGCSSSGGDECTGDYMELCGTECVNIQTNSSHCGGCTNTCGGDSVCSGGQCSCSGSLEYCSSECVNTDTDNDHCGACLAPCSGETQCVQGKCIAPYAESCDGEDNDFDGHTDEDASGQPLTRACDNLCGPGTETCTNGVYAGCTAPASEAETCDEEDNDCDGLTDEDVTTTYYEDYDLDTFGDPDLAWATEACSLPAEPSPNGGVYVEDNTDCDDVDETVYPGAPELCDDLDNNCNDDVDEECACSPVDGTRECGTDEGVCVKGTQTCTVDGWGECGGDDYIPAALGESCNHLDDDCDGQTDEELADDAYDANDTCALARGLPDVNEGLGPLTIGDLSLYHGSGTAQDVDWYTIHAEEAFHLDCLLYPGEYQCNFRFVTQLTVPSDDVHEDYVMCVHTGECGDFDYTFCTDVPADGATYNETTHSYEMILTWDGLCGLDDSWDFFIEVKYADEAPTACDAYEIEFELLYDGPIGETCP